RTVPGHGLRADECRVDVPRALAHARRHRRPRRRPRPHAPADQRLAPATRLRTRTDVDRWIAHPTRDAYWRARSVTTDIARVRARFPKYDRNLGTGGDNERDSTFVVAH